MSELTKRISELSPEKQALLISRLRKKHLAATVETTGSVVSSTGRSPFPQDQTILRRDDLTTYPLSFAQQRLWFLDQFEPDSAFYNIPAALHIAGPLNVPALKQSLNEIVQRHEILRATFVAENGHPRQIVAPQLTLPLPTVDLCHLPPTERRTEALRLATKEARRPFDLSCGPLVRAGLLRLQKDEHILLLTMHHIVYDGWSTNVLVREISALYHACSHGRPSPLPPLPIQYADYASWQRQSLQGRVLEQQLAYWKQKLAPIPSPLELPTNRSRPPAQTFQGAHHSFELPRHLYQNLVTLSRRENVSLFMTLLAAFQTLLYRYTEHRDITVGTPIANRTRVELEGLIGFFVNTLVVRTDLSGKPGFRDILKRVRQGTLADYAHQDLPFERLVEVLQPERDMSHSPLFQVMFELQQDPLQSLQLGNLKLDLLKVETGTAKFDLTLTMTEKDGKLNAELEYNTHLFDTATIRRMAGHFHNLLQGIAINPDHPVATLPLLTKTEQQQLFTEWNDTPIGYPRDRPIHQLFEAQVERTPNAIAVAFGDEQLTYKELNERANRLARHLKKFGTETPIGIYLERSLEMVVGLLGVLKAGGAYLPLDPAFPRERLAFMLADSKTALLLTHKSMGEMTFGPGKITAIYLDSDWPRIALQSAENLPNQAQPDNLAYVIYTSGSTGTPKGVQIRHKAVVNFLTSMRQEPGLIDSDLLLSVTTLSFDIAVLEIFLPLTTGARLMLVNRQVAADGIQLMTRLALSDATVMQATPTTWRMLIQSGWQGDDKLKILCGGEALPRDLANQLLKRCHSLWNMYGPTETTVWSTTYRLQPDQGAVPIGRPIGNTQLYVLDTHLHPLPVGVPGELYIAGDGLARGYWNRPKLTASNFIPHPFSHRPNARLYKTGDLVRYLPDGNIEFVGRIDHQIKIRGFRVELGEIEALLVQHTGVRQAVVILRKDPPGDKRLVAYLIPTNPEAPPTTSELRNFARQKLPHYMLPSAFVFLDTYPLTPNKKIDRKALPPPDQTRPDLKTAYIVPRTPIEKMLTSIWTQILGVHQVGIHDNFFELGGHSLLATQLVSRLRNAFQIELPLRNLFETPTVAGLAETVEVTLKRSPGLKAPPIRPVSREGDSPLLKAGELPLSFAQQRLWFLDQLEPNSPFYNIPHAVRINGPLDVTVLKKSLNEIVHRHEVLRTTFPTVDGKPAQIIAPELALPLKTIDLTMLPQAEREREALHRARQDAQRPFELAQGPLLRATLLQLNKASNQNQEHILLLTIHHIVSDGWSTTLLIREVAALYDAFSHGRPSPLQELPIQYADFAHWQRRWLQGQVLENQLTYWKQQLDGLSPSLNLPTDRPRPPVQTFRGATHWFELPGHLFEQLQSLSLQEDVTLFMTLLAAFQTLLYRYTGQKDISIGTPIATRNRAEIEKLIGLFVNTLVIRTDLSAEPTFRQLLKRVREVTLAAYTHQDIPFEMLVDALQPERDLTRTPLFQVMFALQNALLESLALPGLTLTPLKVDSGTARFDLTLFMLETDNKLWGAVEYNTDLFNAATIDRILGHFQTLLQSIVADPDRHISTLSLLTQAEQQQLLAEWNDTSVKYPRRQCVHQLFEAQVEQSPTAVAVTFRKQHLTYMELNRQANQLAHHLQELGVGPETLVSICMERSLETIVGVMGILKAGGAYVPMDPTYPRERLAFMLKDTRSPVLLTQKRLLAALPSCQARVICLDTDWQTIAGQSSENPVSHVTSKNLAYLIYTSGSTGQPKGVLIEHKGLLNLVFWHQQTFSISRQDRATQIAGPGFDASVWEIWPYLTIGASIHIPDDDTRALPLQLLDWLVSKAITISFLPTPLTENVLSLNWPDDLALRTLLTGGDKLLHYPSATLPIELVNNYGPTEDTVVTTSGLVPPGEQTDLPPHIGRPIANTHLYILDRHLQPVSIGVPGELYVGGAGLARGYLDRPELTAERFIPHPFCQRPNARLYKTGDLVRYRPDGNIEFLGRIDHQVKLRGFRIELGEIETVLNHHPAVREVVILAREDEPGRKQLVAYIVPEQEPSPDVGQLRSFLQDKLPEYMVPSAFVTLKALPLTPNGKIDRPALPAPDWTHPDLKTAYLPPRTREEEILHNIWSQVLGLEQMGVHDNFFELGGDSISSIQVIARANQARLQLTPRQLFERPTIAGLAAVTSLGTLLKEGASPLLKEGDSPFLKTGDAPDIHAGQDIVQGDLPLTPIQRWFFEQDLPQPHHWNQSVLLQVQQALDPTLLQKALEHILLHHDALRLRFRRKGSDWHQINAGLDRDIPFAWVDLSAQPQTEQKSALETHAAALQRSLDLAAGPLLRVAYFDLGPDRPDRLLIIVHHLAVDGVSWRILLQDLSLAYDQLCQGTDTGSPNSFGKAIQLPPKTTSFQHWARRLQEYAQTETARKELPYWLALSQTSIPSLPLDYPDGSQSTLQRGPQSSLKRGANTEASARSVSVSLTEEETQALLRQVPTAYGTEINDALLTALAQAVAGWTGARTLLIDLEGHGREGILQDVDLSRTVGWFTTIFPLSLDLQGAHGPGEALKTVKEQLRQLPNRGIGYGLLRYLSDDQNALRQLPRPQLSFNYLGQFDHLLSQATPFALAAESTGPAHSPQATRSHLLSINGRIVHGRLELHWSYSKNLHRRSTIENLAQAFVAALRALIAHCQSPHTGGYTPSDFSEAEMSQKEIDLLLAEMSEAIQ